MSGVFNALSTAVSGINAQSDAFTNLSNNIANSQTTGYKATTTSFADFVAGNLRGNSTSQAESNTVQAVSVQHVDNAGTATVSTNSLAMDISGNGMFVTTRPTGASSLSSGQTIFSSQKYYTRNGDFSTDKKGYLVNTAGYYLQGYMTDSTGALSTSLSQVNLNNIAFKPTMTTQLNFNAAIGKLPDDKANFTPQTYTSATTTAYDNNGSPHKIATQWQESKYNPLVWNVSVYDADGTGSIASNSFQVTFNTSGALEGIQDSSGKQIGSTITGTAAEIPFVAKYSANTEQDMTLNLGTIGGTSGATMISAKSSPSPSQANPLLSASANSSQLTVASQSIIGTTTGSNQSYMTSPAYIGTQTDSNGNPVNQTPVSLKWTQISASPQTWTVQAVNPYDAADNNVSSQASTVTFNSNGTINSVSGGTANNDTITAQINGTKYDIGLNKFSLTTDNSVSAGDGSALTNDSITSGIYTGAQIDTDGSIMAQFDNGYSQLIGKVALATFNNVNGLQAVDGQAYKATDRSGSPTTGLVGQNGTGTITPGYTEASTTNLTGDLSALIVAQEAYAANTKIVTTADTMLQQTVAMKQ